MSIALEITPPTLGIITPQPKGLLTQPFPHQTVGTPHKVKQEEHTVSYR